MSEKIGHLKIVRTIISGSIWKYLEMRENYRFSQEGKREVHKRAGNSCEFPADKCERPNNNIVHHLTGAFEAYLDNKDSRAISDVSMNALMLCDPHAQAHDATEKFQVECLKGERVIYERRIDRGYKSRVTKSRKSRFTNKRR